MRAGSATYHFPFLMQLTQKSADLLRDAKRWTRRGQFALIAFVNLLEWALKLSRKRLKPTSLATYRSWYGRYEARLVTPVGLTHPTSPGHESPEQMLQALEGLGDYLNQKRTVALLNWIYSTLRHHGHPLANPTPAIEGLFRADHRTTHTAMPGSWQSRLAQAASNQAKGWKGTRLIAMVVLLSEAALKTSELIALQISNLHGADCLQLEVGVRSNTRIISLSPETSEAIRQWLSVHPAADSPFLFVRDAGGRAMDPSTVWRQIVRVTDAAGISPAGHAGTGAIRASKARELVDQGLSTSGVAQFLGHRQEGSTGELLTRIRQSRSPAAPQTAVNGAMSPVDKLKIRGRRKASD